VAAEDTVAETDLAEVEAAVVAVGEDSEAEAVEAEDTVEVAAVVEHGKGKSTEYHFRSLASLPVPTILKLEVTFFVSRLFQFNNSLKFHTACKGT